MPKKNIILQQGNDSKSLQIDREPNRYNVFAALDDDDSDDHDPVVKKDNNGKSIKQSNQTIDNSDDVESKKGNKNDINKIPRSDDDGFQVATYKGKKKNKNSPENKRRNIDFSKVVKPQNKTNQMKTISKKIQKDTPVVPLERTLVPSARPVNKTKAITKSEPEVDSDLELESKTNSKIDKNVNGTEDIADEIDIEKIDKPKKKGLYVPPSIPGMAMPSSGTSDSGWNQVNNRKKKDKFGQDKRGKDQGDDDDIETTEEFPYYNPLVKLPGDDMRLNSLWTVWVHENENQNWDLASYESIFQINSIGNMWRFLNVFANLNKNVRQYFIMRDGITPIWEDNNNKHGAICSIMIDNTNRGGRHGRHDLGVDAFTAMCILVLNESFVKNNHDINGLCYSIKSRSVLIKLWVRDFKINEKFETKLPYTFLKTLEALIINIDGRGYQRNNGKSLISVQTKPIKPNY
jgi:hypothetical protein